MIVGELRHGQLSIIDRLKETVRLSEGLVETGHISPQASARALDCLSRFGQRLREIHVSRVRAAGTSALRRASDSGDFRRVAEEKLGHPIEVISGIEEARLIYNGVQNSMPPYDGFRLVLDIGGGSTELILGRGEKPRALESLHMGCVVMTERYFGDGVISKANFKAARMAARLKLRPVKAFFRDTKNIEAVGCSGTILSTENVARQVGEIESNDLTTGAVEALIERVIDCGQMSELRMSGLSERRSQVWPGGLAILVELMEVLRIDQLKVSDGALREGLIYDQLGRQQHEDAREISVQALALRYNVDAAQAERVARTAGDLLGHVSEPWGLDNSLAQNMLQWAAAVHEIGLDIAHNGFQRHGAYIAANADLPGFPRSEQKLLAFLIASQRSELTESGQYTVTARSRDVALRLSILLRLAVLLHRSRSMAALPDIRLAVEDSALRLQFPDGWLGKNPLTIADLQREQVYLAKAGFTLSFS